MDNPVKTRLGDALCRRLLAEAQAARERSYSPYSGFAVGAALMTGEGHIYRGCNIENAAYGPANCAERTAFFKAVSEGENEFSCMAIVGGPAGQAAEGTCPPCGVCRQVMREFCRPKEFVVILPDGAGGYCLYTLEELLPLGFGPDNLAG